MIDHTQPPLPIKRKGHGLPVGPGVFWYRVWCEYHEAGGCMGYARWIEANRALQKEAEMREKRKQSEHKARMHSRVR